MQPYDDVPNLVYVSLLSNRFFLKARNCLLMCSEIISMQLSGYEYILVQKATAILPHSYHTICRLSGDSHLLSRDPPIYRYT
jgi:hypothetical protein